MAIEAMAHTATLPTDPKLLQQMNAELLEQLAKSRRTEKQLRSRIDELLRKLYGRRSEKIDPNQLLIDLGTLGITPEPEAPAEEERELEPAPAKPKRKAKRRRPSKELPRRRVEHELCEAERLCPCCQVPMAKIREELSEQLDYHPATLEVLEHVRFVYGCAKGCDEAVHTAPKPPQMIEKSVAGPGLLAHVVTSKYADHLPLYRLEGMFRRQGAEIARSTMCNWIRALSDRLDPFYQFLKEDLLRSDIVTTDDTTVPVQDKAKGRTKTGRLWAYLGEEAHPWVLFDYTPTRSRAGPEAFLGDYKGYLQADGYSGYDRLFESPDRQEVGCWMHARRYFFKASETSKVEDPRAIEALAMIRELYRIEKSCAQLPAAERHERRQEQAVPILDTFGEWMEPLTLTVPPKSPLGEALTYARNQWAALRRYTEDGRLSIDNGACERAIRPVALGRKNWLFAGSDAGGERAAKLYSLIGTCRRHRLDPFHYLWDLFRRLPAQPADQLHELTPLAWAVRQAQPAETSS